MSKYTHNGWIGSVPVLIVYPPSSEDMAICARWGMPDALIDVQAWVFDSIAWVMGRHDWGYPIKITGKVKA